jgi:diketogulonate reductase-like aldo/keto reductase
MNEIGVGEAVRTSGIAREKIFVTTKVWNSDQGYKKTLDAFHRSLDLLKFDYC